MVVVKSQRVRRVRDLSVAGLALLQRLGALAVALFAVDQNQKLKN